MRRLIASFIALLIPISIGLILISHFEESSEVISTETASEIETSQEERIPFTGTLTCMSPSSVNWKHNKEGSAVYLSGRTGIVTVLVGDKSTKWMKNDLLTVKSKLDISTEYLIECGEQYGYSVELVYGESDMMFYEWYDGSLDDWSNSNYGEMAYKWIERDIKSEELIEKYDLDGIAYLFVLNESGISYAIPHIIEDGKYNYYECAFVYLYDADAPDVYEAPAAYAHELLHLFGAVDLYKSGINDGISLEFEDYIQKKLSNDIMYTTFMSGNIPVQDSITNDMSILTAYTLGWVKEEDVEELILFPEFKKRYTACWSEKDIINHNTH